jgi:hypothetical protein
VQQIVLLLLLTELNMELCVLLFFLHYYQLPHDVMKNVLVGYAVSALGQDLSKHVLESDHIERGLLEREFHNFEHDDDEVLHPAGLLRQSTQLLLYFLKLLVKDEPTDMDRRVFLKRFLHRFLEKLLAEIKSDTHSLLPADETLKGSIVLLPFLLLLPLNFVQLLLFNLAH